MSVHTQSTQWINITQCQIPRTKFCTESNNSPRTLYTNDTTPNKYDQPTILTSRLPSTTQHTKSFPQPRYIKAPRHHSQQIHTQNPLNLNIDGCTTHNTTHMLSLYKCYSNTFNLTQIPTHKHKYTKAPTLRIRIADTPNNIKYT